MLGILYIYLVFILFPIPKTAQIFSSPVALVMKYFEQCGNITKKILQAARQEHKQ